MDRDFDLVVVGELNPDLILRGDIVPSFGQVEKLVDDADLTIGSSAAIFACGAAHLAAAARAANALLPGAGRFQGSDAERFFAEIKELPMA